MITLNPTNPTVAPHLMRGSAFLRPAKRNAPKAAGPRVKHGATEGRLAGKPGRDTKSIHREGAMLAATGPIERRAADEVAVGWDRTVTELDLAA